MLLGGDLARDEDAEMADTLVNRVDDGMAGRHDLLVRAVAIGDPAERLLRQGDVVALRAEAEDRRADRREVGPPLVGQQDLGGGELVADEQLLDDEADLLDIEEDVATPPALETEVAGFFRVDLRPEIVLLGSERVGRFRLSKLATRWAPSNRPAPRSLASSASRLPPRSLPV